MAEKTLFRQARFRKYEEIVKFDNPDAARRAARELLREFNDAKTRAKERRVKRVAVFAANRALKSSRRENLSQRERKELQQIAGIYAKAARMMQF